ncbi:MAG TPA: response regulator [Armatimonadota bacterium]|nr:response regulator [Armatimonadota bacterium]
MPKIMVVDDEPDLVRLVQFRLEREGWEVVTASDGLSAVSLVIEEKPDLLFLDVMMPGMDGFEVLEQIRTRRDLHKIPVVMLTAKGGATDLEKARSLHVQHYVIKPFDPDRLVATAKKILRLE